MWRTQSQGPISTPMMLEVHALCQVCCLAKNVYYMTGVFLCAVLLSLALRVKSLAWLWDSVPMPWP